MKRHIYILFATLCTGLGLVGAFLPVLPTTPFLLLAIYLYMRSSKAGVKMILRNRYLAPYVKSYFSRRGIPVATLVRTLFLLWITIGACIIWATDNLYLRLFLLLVAVGVTVHLVGNREKLN